MDTFKKIYISIMGMTVIALIILCLYTLGIFDISIKMTPDGLDTTNLLAYIISLSIVLMGFVFSRSANVIANRKNHIIGYLTVFAGLLVLLILAIVLIFKIDLNGTFIKFISFLILGIILLTLMVLVFEVPQANSGHGKFQRITALIIAVTFIFYAVDSKNYLESITSLTDNNDTSPTQTESTFLETSDTDFNNSEKDEEETDKIPTKDKIKTILLFTSIGTFLLNPMIRVYYIDKDYAQVDEINNLISNTTADKYQTGGNVPNPQAIFKEKYQKQVEETLNNKKKNQNRPTDISTPSIVEEIQPQHEKVVNLTFKQNDELPDAVIPSISGDDPVISVTPQDNENNNTFINNIPNSEENNMTNSNNEKMLDSNPFNSVPIIPTNEPQNNQNNINLTSNDQVPDNQVSATPIETTPVQVPDNQVNATPIEANPVQVTDNQVSATPIEANPVQVTDNQVSATPIENTPMQVPDNQVSSTPIEVTPVQVPDNQVSATPIEANPVQVTDNQISATPMENNPMQVLDNQTNTTPIESTPVQVEDNQANTTPIEVTPMQVPDNQVSATPIETTPVQVPDNQFTTNPTPTEQVPNTNNEPIIQDITAIPLINPEQLEQNNETNQ